MQLFIDKAGWKEGYLSVPYWRWCDETQFVTAGARTGVAV